MKRRDGRALDELRPVTIERGFVKYAQGSALISLGNTRVLCAAMVEEGTPSFLRGSGQGWLTAEYNMLPYSTPTRTPREVAQQKGRSCEIQRLIGRCLRAVVQLDRLGEYTIWVDCDVLQADGGTRCAAITGAFVALVDVDRWLRKKGMVDGSIIKDSLAAVSVGVSNGEKMLDLSFHEDSQASIDMNVAMTGGGDLVEIQISGEKSSFSRKLLEELLDLAEVGIKRLRQVQREVVGAEEWNW
ncbi:ribonuclease PH [Candidatus Aerophobetes bacterium]|uniref:Ribonuclease PH n=1 Tax=Aerophobetes bacterium TaxID=2030807 RepID=A0A497E3A5_UNCAE|nr:ribonuclease PH [Candidatus Aerophobetes bacterium]RLE08939.1 MAG: ribonuclease PH [Candidatus Aerophobetes bacterium]